MSHLLVPLSSSRTAALAVLNAARKPFIGTYRAQMMLSTVVAILGVDFVVFPRRFAKAEHAGFGLMDVGVGSFILAHAIVSPMARPRPPPSGTSIISKSASSRAWGGTFVHMLKSWPR